MKSFDDIKRESEPLARELEARMRAARPRRSLPIALLSIAGADERLRKAVLRFVNVLPRLRSTRDIQEHLNMYIGPHQDALPKLARKGLRAMSIPGANIVSANAIRWLIRKSLAPYFIVKDEKKFGRIQRSYRRQGAGVIADILGELVLSDEKAHHFLMRYIHIMHAQGYKAEPFHISVKFSSLYPYFAPEHYAGSKRRVQESFRNILRQGVAANSFVSVDMEYYELWGLIEDIFLDTICEGPFRNNPQVGIAEQTYFKDSPSRIRHLVEVAQGRGTPFVIRLVKGAYWDREVAIADQKNWPLPPVFLKKEETDENFDRLVYFLLQHWGEVYVSPATHNPASIAFAVCAARELEILDDPNFTFQVLYGLGEPIRKTLCAEGLPVRVYMPLSGGDLDTDMSYFARRILENTANENFVFKLITGR